MRDTFSVVPPERSIVGVIEHITETFFQTRPPRGYVEDLLSKGQALVIFDGLNELPNVAARATSSIIELFSREFPEAHVVVTSRPAGYALASLDPTHFRLFKLEEFYEDQIAEYLKKLLALDTDLTGYELQDRVESWLSASEALANIRSNPLFLSFASQLYKKTAEVPTDLTGLILKMSDLLLHQWDLSRGVGPRSDGTDLTLRNLRPMLEYLAFYILQNNLNGIPESELIRQLTYFILRSLAAPVDARGFIDVVRNRSLMLSEVGMTPDGDAVYMFTHRTFMEFFAASYIASNPGAISTDVNIASQLSDSQWRSTLNFALALADADTAEQLLHDVAEQAQSLDPEIREQVRRALLSHEDYASARLMQLFARDQQLPPLPAESVSDSPSATAGIAGKEHEHHANETQLTQRESRAAARFPELKNALREWLDEAVGLLSADEAARDLTTSLGHWRRDSDGTFRYAEHIVEIWNRNSVDRVFDLSHWAVVLEVLQSDNRLKRQLDTLVGTVQGSHRLEAANIGRNVLPRPNELGQLDEVFEKRYSELEDFLATNEIEYTVIWPLPGLVSTVLPVQLDSTLELDAMSDRELGTALDIEVIHMTFPRNRVLSREAELRNCARYRYRLPKVVGNKDANNSIRVLQEIEDRLRDIESRLKESLLLVLHEPVYVAGRFCVVSEPGGPLAGAVAFQQSRLLQGMQLRRVDMNDGQAAELLDVWHQLHQPGLLGKRKGLALALRRLSYQAQWERPEDELLDTMIAAEALYLTELGNESEQGELRYRLALRAAFWADPGQVGYTKPEVRRIMESAYDARSKIAHGGIPAPEEMKLRDQIVSLEELVKTARLIIISGGRAALATAASPGAAWPPDWDDLAFGASQSR